MPSLHGSLHLLSLGHLLEAGLLQHLGQGVGVLGVGVGHLHRAEAGRGSRPVPGDSTDYLSAHWTLAGHLATRLSSSWNMKLRLALNFIFSSCQWLVEGSSEELERVFTVNTRTHTTAVYSASTVHVTCTMYGHVISGTCSCTW